MKRIKTLRPRRKGKLQRQVEARIARENKHPFYVRGYFLLAYAGLVGALITLFGVPHLRSAPRRGRERAARFALLDIAKAQEQYNRDRTWRGPPAGAPRRRYYGTLADLRAKGYIDAELASGTMSGYFFVVTLKDGGREFEARATPVEPGVSGRWEYFIENEEDRLIVWP